MTPLSAIVSICWIPLPYFVSTFPSPPIPHPHPHHFAKKTCEQSLTSRPEQAPGSEFHPWEESDKNYCDFFGPSGCNKKVNPETYVHCGSFKMLVSNVAHQMKVKLLTLNNFSYLLRENLLKYDIFSLFSGSKQPELYYLRKIVNRIYQYRCLGNKNLIFFLIFLYLLRAPLDDVFKKMQI